MVESYLIFSFFTVYVNNWLPVFSLFVVEPLIHLLVSKVHACTDLFWAVPSFGDSSFHRVAMFPFACFSCHWVDIFRFVLLHRPIVLFLTCLLRQRWIRVISPFPAAFDSNSFTLFHCSFLLHTCWIWNIIHRRNYLLRASHPWAHIFTVPVMIFRLSYPKVFLSVDDTT